MHWTCPSKKYSLVGQTPLEFNSTVAPSIEDCTLGAVPHGGTLLGWKFLVAPTSKTACEGDPSNFNKTQVGSFHKLPGRDDATYQVAPSLCHVIRSLLEGKQISPEGVENYLNQLPSLPRYDSAFKSFYAFTRSKKLVVQDLTVDQVAGLLLEMNSINPSKARHAILLCFWSQVSVHSDFHPC
jgi:hypothetical protein